MSDALAALRSAIAEAFDDLIPTHDEALSCARAQRLISHLDLAGLALLCRDWLAWDVESFLSFLDIEINDPRKITLTEDEQNRITRLNGGKPFTINLNDWDT